MLHASGGAPKGNPQQRPAERRSGSAASCGSWQVTAARSGIYASSWRMNAAASSSDQMTRSGRSRTPGSIVKGFPFGKSQKRFVCYARLPSRPWIALAVPTLAMAQGHEEHHPGERPPAGAPRGPHPGGPAGPHPGGPPGRVMYHGRAFSPVHVAPFVYPPGFGYRRWIVGAALPPLFLAPAYYYAGWAAFGLAPPQPGYQWVRYGPDLLLVNVSSGQVVDTVYGAFY